MKTAEVDRARMAQRARQGFLTVTELADTLARHEGLSFREAHELVAGAVQASGLNDDSAAIARALRRIRPALALTDAEIERALDPEHFIRIRNIPGGPAPERTREALARALQEQRRIEAWMEEKAEHLKAARRSLRS
jgi:argininosuccinate lyase